MEKQGQKGYSAFISYATPDKEKAEEICASLENKGFSCWIAPRQVRAGRDYGEEIILGIEASGCLVLVLSEASNESTFVRREVERAVSKRKPVFPVRVEEVMPSRGLELFISTTHWIDAWSGPLSEHTEHLAAQLGDDNALAEAAMRSAKLAPRKRLPKWVTSIAAVLVIAGVVALVNHLTKGNPEKDNTNTTGGGDTPAEVPGGPGPGPVGPGPTPEEIFRQSIDATGVDPASIEADEISLSAKSESRGLLGIQLKHSEQLNKLGFLAGKLQLAIGQDGAFKEVGTGITKDIGYRAIDQDALKQEKLVRLRYDLQDGRTIGPFSYPFDPDALQSDLRKQEIEDRDEWVSASFAGTNILFSPLIGFFDIIKAIRIGKTEETLDRTIDILPKDEGKLSDPNVVYAEQSNYNRSVPYPPGEREIFVQLEFTDGTRSSVRKVSLPEQKFASIQLSPESNVGNAPEVYVLYTQDPSNQFKDLFSLLPFAPRGTKRILRSHDGGSLNAFRPHLYTRTSLEFAGGSAPEGSTVQFLFQMTDGSEQGPYSYKLDGVLEMPLQGFKQKMLEVRREAVAAFRIKSREQIQRRGGGLGGGGDDSQLADLSGTQQRRTWGDLFPYDRETKSKFMEAAPAVMLFPVNQSGNPYRYWAAVKEIRYGTSKDNLVQSTPVNLELKEALSSSGIIRKFVWHAILPAETKEIYCKFVFRDGEESPPFSVPIEDL